MSEQVLEQIPEQISEETTILEKIALKRKSVKETIKVEKYVDNQGRKCAIVHAPRPVNIPIPLTGNTEAVNVKFLAIKNEDVYIIDEIPHRFMHFNVQPQERVETLRNPENSAEYIEVKLGHFCNEIKSNQLLKSPKNYVYQLMYNLENPNPSSAYSTPTDYFRTHVSIINQELGIFCKDCGCFISAESAPINLFMGYCADCIVDNRESLRDYDLWSWESYRKGCTDSGYAVERRVTKESAYYPALDYADIISGFKNMSKVTKDVICLGLGSAGTNMLEQLARLTYINTFKLADYDYIEEKNLRNQFYTASDLGKQKAVCAQAYLRELKKKAKGHTKNFENIKYDYVSSKYTILGFDTIRTRKKALDCVIKDVIESKYIVDIRYDDLTASIYFIDMNNAEQLSYYKERLDIDYEELEAPFKGEGILRNIDELFNMFSFQSTCVKLNQKIRGDENINYTCCRTSEDSERCVRPCGGETCKEFMKQYLIKHKETSKIQYVPRNENTCIKYNLMPIYKYASTFVAAAVCEIEEGREKPFTHIECGIEKGLLGHVKIR